MRPILTIIGAAVLGLAGWTLGAQTTEPSPAPAPRQTQIQKRDRIHAPSNQGGPGVTRKQGNRSGVCDGTGPKGNRGGGQAKGGGRARR